MSTAYSCGDPEQEEVDTSKYVSLRENPSWSEEQIGHVTYESVQWEQIGHVTYESVQWEQIGHVTYESVQWEQIGHVTYESVQWEQIGHVTYESVQWEQIGHVTYESVRGNITIWTNQLLTTISSYRITMVTMIHDDVMGHTH